MCLPTLVTYFDFRKVFDCVQHSVLLEKLNKLNLDMKVVKWVESYLSLRKHRVFANSIYSSFLHITQGVPQASILCPLFYIIYANDLSDVFTNCKLALYADDTILYTANKNFGESLRKMQADLNSLSAWCSANGIEVNTDKTKVMTFGSSSMLNKLPQCNVFYGGTPIEKVTSYKYLGMTLDNQLNFNLHVNRVIATVLVYECMLLPLLEYGDILLSSTSAINLAE